MPPKRKGTAVKKPAAKRSKKATPPAVVVLPSTPSRARTRVQTLLGSAGHSDDGEGDARVQDELDELIERKVGAGEAHGNSASQKEEETVVFVCWRCSKDIDRILECDMPLWQKCEHCMGLHHECEEVSLSSRP